MTVLASAYQAGYWTGVIFGGGGVGLGAMLLDLRRRDRTAARPPYDWAKDDQWR